MPLKVASSVTKTANGQDLYVSASSNSLGAVSSVAGTVNEITVVNGTTNAVVSLAPPSPAPTAGDYTNANITVDGLGRVTAAASNVAPTFTSVSAGSLTSSGAVSAGSLVAAGGYNSVVLPNVSIPASIAPFGPVFTRPCVVGVNVSDTTTPTGAGGITQNRYLLVRLSFTNTGTNQLTNNNLIDSNPGGAGSNINIIWDVASGRFTFANNATPIDPTTITFAIMNQA